jgi:hypothetical protein
MWDEVFLIHRQADLFLSDPGRGNEYFVNAGGATDHNLQQREDGL